MKYSLTARTRRNSGQKTNARMLTEQSLIVSVTPGANSNSNAAEPLTGDPALPRYGAAQIPRRGLAPNDSRDLRIMLGADTAPTTLNKRVLPTFGS
jgi:hypothetical protein